MKRNLLYVAYHDEDCEEGLAYAIDLAKIMDKGITILLVCRKRFMERFENAMTAVAFAEAGCHDTAERICSCSDINDDGPQMRMNFLAGKCRESGIDVSVQTAGIDIVSAVKDFLGKKTAIDLVLLSPSVTSKRNVSAKELRKLVNSASRPVVTMTKQAMSHGMAKALHPLG